MSAISKGIVCRICKNNNDGICLKGNTYGADKRDECWRFEDRNKHSGLADHSENSIDWRLR